MKWDLNRFLVFGDDINRVISQRHVPVCISELPDILLTEPLQSSACPYPLFGACHSGLFQMFQDGLRRGEGEGYNLLFGMKYVEVGSQQLLKALDGQIVQSVSGQTADLMHVLCPESAEGEDTVLCQCMVATEKESFRIIEPLQGGTGSYQVRVFGEVKAFCISRQKTDFSLRAALLSGDGLCGTELSDALLHFPAQVVQQQSFRLQGVEEDT